MQLELHCPCCGSDFVHEPAFAQRKDWQRAEQEVLWDALGDGGTIEDSLHAALSGGAPIRCPDCQAPVEVSETDLNRLAMSMLASW